MGGDCDDFIIILFLQPFFCNAHFAVKRFDDDYDDVCGDDDVTDSYDGVLIIMIMKILNAVFLCLFFRFRGR